MMLSHSYSLGSFSSLCIIPLFLLSAEIASDGTIWLAVEAGAAFDSDRVCSAVLRSNLWLLAVLPVLHELGHRVVGQIFVEILAVDLDHRCVDASAEALDLLQSEKSIFTGLSQLNAIEILDSFDDVLRLNEHNNSIR